MFRKFITLLMVFSLCWTTVACSSASNVESPNGRVSSPVAQKMLPTGQYSVQQASYNDANGEYRLFLLNASPSDFSTADLQMARLTDDEIKAGQKSYLKVENGQASLHLSEDFKIEYIHAVTETQTNPQTGQPQTVIVRQQSSFWTPFAGALAGQIVGNMLFTPRYYVPPVYQPGVNLTGYGGYGNTYNQAVDRYQSRYQAPPIAVQNSTRLRTTGRINSNQPRTNTPSSSRNKSTGSGFGSSTLRQSNQSRPSRVKPGSGSFGSGGRRSAGATSRRRR